MLPTSLLGKAKRAYEKRNRINPRAEYNYRELFRSGKREASETVSAYINRLRMYVRDMLQHKVHKSLPTSICKLLKATVGQSDNLNKVIAKADSLLADQRENKSEDEPNYMPSEEFNVPGQKFPRQLENVK